MLIMIRYIGAGEHYEALHLTPDAIERFETDWRMFLSTGKPKGGFYSCIEAGNEYVVSLHFEGVAAVHFGNGNMPLGTNGYRAQATLREGRYSPLMKLQDSASWFG